MSEWKWIAVGLAVVAAMVLGWVWWGQQTESGLELTILHTNDVHAHYESWGDPIQGGAARLATAISDVRSEGGNTLLLDAGDQFQGTLYYNVGGSTIVADVMNALAYDAMCLGNHEFDSGPAETLAFIDRANFPVLSANIDASADASLSGQIEAYATFAFGDETVAVFGLTSETTSIASSPGPNVAFLDAVETAQRTAERLERRGIDKIIALTHLGYTRDVELAGRVEGIDIIVGGHTHTLLGGTDRSAGPYPTLVTSACGDPVLVVTAYEWGKLLGRLDVLFDADGVVVQALGAPVEIDGSLEENPVVAALLEPYVASIEALKSKTVGATDVELNGDRTSVRSQETNLGNLICDAMLWKTASLGAQVALQNGGGIRASVPAGIISMGHVLEILPYGNQISVLDLTGSQLVEALENGVSQVESGAGRFPQVSGLRYSFDPAGEAGHRILSVEILDNAASDYIAIDPAGLYVVATNTYLADGGDGFESFIAASARYDTGFLLSDMLAEYLEAMSPVSPALEGRIESAVVEEGEAE